MAEITQVRQVEVIGKKELYLFMVFAGTVTLGALSGQLVFLMAGLMGVAGLAGWTARADTEMKARL